MAFSYEREEEGETSFRNLKLAEETEKVYKRFLLDNREENNLRLIVVAQKEIANNLEEQGLDVDIPIGWTVTPDEELTTTKLMNQALAFIKNSPAKEVILVTPFWRKRAFQRLAKKSGLIPIRIKIKHIGLWPCPPNWWRKSLIRLLFRSLTSPFRDQ
jgi:hypothetical protein